MIRCGASRESQCIKFLVTRCLKKDNQGAIPIVEPLRVTDLLPNSLPFYHYQSTPCTPYRGHTTSSFSNVAEPSAVVALVTGIGKANQEVGFAAFDVDGNFYP